MSNDEDFISALVQGTNLNGQQPKYLKVSRVLWDQVPAWMANYTPVVDSRGRLFAYAQTGDLTIWVQHAPWKALTFKPQEGEPKVQNYGLDTHAISQLPVGQMQCSDQATAQELAQTLTGQEQPMPIGSASASNAPAIVLGIAIVLSAVLVMGGLTFKRKG